MRFAHRFEVAAPIEEVAEFHRRSASMAEITPPLIPVRVHAAPERLAPGDRMDFSLYMPMPVRWQAGIEALPDAGPNGGFRDVQRSGPFRRWEHEHRFEPLPEGGTAVIDIVEADLKPHPLWGPLGLLMWLGMPLLFAYRGWRSRAILGQRQASGAER